jgi:hypothetical protein
MRRSSLNLVQALTGALRSLRRRAGEGDRLIDVPVPFEEREHRGPKVTSVDGADHRRVAKLRLHVCSANIFCPVVPS